MHQLRHLYQPDFEGPTSAKYSSYCVSQEEAEDCQRLFTTVQIGGQGEVINLDVRRWLRKWGPSHLQDQHGCRELKNKVFEPCLWQCFCSGLGFQVLRHVEILGWRVWWTISKTKRFWGAFFTIWMCIYKVKLGCWNRDWKPATNGWCQWHWGNQVIYVACVANRSRT